MFGSIGVVEIIVLAGIALIVMGPEKFPDFAKIVARTIRDVRGYMNEAQQSLAEELKPMRKELDKLSRLDADKVIDKWAGTDADGEKKAEKSDYKPVNKPAEDTAPVDDTGYNPEPEGPTLDGTFSYGSFSGKPEEPAASASAEEETAVNAEAPRYPAAGDAPSPTDGAEPKTTDDVAAPEENAQRRPEPVLPKTMERLDG